ncbi:MAG: MBL fold metallo-hydrolase [Spirochaetaceae bacterium]|jgi:glyoxylase-like metal-dependent hydrolase (beta-lactamase superfamily II)|nr:MBL fold metallo-hydrolase [Spirochaetaceae bacterium]
MNILVHYCLPSFTNCYILGGDRGLSAANGSLNDSIPADTPAAKNNRDAILIDPGDMDAEILEYIESNDYWLRAVLVTHDHHSHVQGLRTLMRIYDVDIYAVNHVIMDRRANVVKGGDIITIGPFRIEVISVPGHSADSVVYKIDRFLFTGDALTAGLVGSTASSYGAALQISAIRGKLLSLPGDFVILPGHGPPSSLEAERRFNTGVQLFDQNKNRRPKFTSDYLL